MLKHCGGDGANQRRRGPAEGRGRGEREGGEGKVGGGGSAMIVFANKSSRVKPGVASQRNAPPNEMLGSERTGRRRGGAGPGGAPLASSHESSSTDSQ